MGGGAADRPHFVQDGAHAAARDLPGGLGSGQSASDDVNGLVHVSSGITFASAQIFKRAP